MELSLRIPKALLIAVGVLLLIGGVGGGAYYLGDASGPDEGAGRDEARQEGYEEGRDVGYDAGFNAGKAKAVSGESVFGLTYHDGLREGKTIGYDDGYDDGYKDGGENAIGAASFDWLTGSSYVISVREGPAPLTYSINTQLLMEPGQEYEARGREVFGGATD